MGNDNFIEICQKIVANYANDNFEFEEIEEFKGMPNVYPEQVITVWICKAIQNNKGLFIVPFIDDVYFEVTFNGDEQEVYLDVYGKFDKTCTKLDLDEDAINNYRWFYLKDDEE